MTRCQRTDIDVEFTLSKPRFHCTVHVAYGGDMGAHRLRRVHVTNGYAFADMEFASMNRHYSL